MQSELLAAGQMKPIITAFSDSPDKGRGLARDMPVRWALEEVGKAYDVRLVPFSELKASGHRAIHPFGKIPTYEERGLTLFESGTIVFHIADRHQGLLPEEPHARYRSITWMFAAVSTMEPPIVERDVSTLVEGDRSWLDERLPLVDGRIRERLSELSRWLGYSEWLDGVFTARDLIIVSVLRRLTGSGLMDELPKLLAFVARGEARPAFKRAFAAQLAVFEANHNARERPVLGR